MKKYEVQKIDDSFISSSNEGMDHLWAPWRNQYVTVERHHSDHLFFEIGQSNEDERHFIVHRSKTCYAILNRYPYNAGHLLVIPYREIPELTDLSEQENSDLWATVNEMTSRLRSTFHPDGFNIGINIGSAAGAGLPQHLHVHIVPRWQDDANFTTTTANTRIHPSNLEEIYKKLKTTP